MQPWISWPALITTNDVPPRPPLWVVVALSCFVARGLRRRQWRSLVGLKLLPRWADFVAEILSLDALGKNNNGVCGLAKGGHAGVRVCH